MKKQAELHLFCGKMAAGKSTLENRPCKIDPGKSPLAIRLAKQLNAVLIVEDHWLANLFPDRITDIPGYIKYSDRLNKTMFEHVTHLLTIGTSVVLDFPANTIKQRALLKNIIQNNNIPHTLHYINTSDEQCKKQLKIRSKDKAEGTAFTTDKAFDEITQYFQAPTESENFNIIEYN